MIHRQNRPCGACAELVPADEGCEHWNPNLSSKAARERDRRRRGREELAAFRRMMRLGDT